MTCKHRLRHELNHFRKSGVLLGAGAILSISSPAMAGTWYVDGLYGLPSGNGSYASPLKYFWQAMQLSAPGDTIYLQPTTTYSTLWIQKGGSAGAPLTIAGAGIAPNLTKVNGGGGAFAISIGASYVTVTNLDVTAPGTYEGIHAPSGFHHITISYSNIHDSGGNGIGMVGNDYVLISHNTVHGNAKDTLNGVFGSGISVKAALDIDASTATKVQIDGNIVYANTNMPNCTSAPCYLTAEDSDGSGIIIDNNRRTQYDNIWYHGHTLISSNVVFGNGGRGIHSYLSDHIMIDGNTAYSNNQDPYEGNYRPGEISGSHVGDVSVYNNILYSDGGHGINNGAYTGTHVPVAFEYCNSVGTITIGSNLGYRPQNDVASFFYGQKNLIPINVLANLWGDPLFERQTLNPQLANFRVMAASQAIGAANNRFALLGDILYARRTSPSSIGAYEAAGP